MVCGNKLTQTEIETYLKGAANLLRGYIDAGDYKQYIFPLLFYKRICDVYDEEYQLALKESGGDVEFAEFAENHRFIVPKDYHWNVIREYTSNIGQHIQRALREIERANIDTLAGIFGDASWTNKDRLSDSTLKDLIEHFSTLTLDNSHVNQDELGNAYEFLIKHFADDSGHTAAEFYTNRTLVKLMTLLLDIQPGESVYDPTCGTGGMLMVAAMHLKEEGMEYRNLKLYGQEINMITSAVAKMNMFLHGIENFKIVRGDTLSRPYFTEKNQLMQFDVVLANPPYSIKKWDRKSWENDPYGRNLFGTPPQGCADYAFFQHIIKSMNPETGRCAILFPHGVLFRDNEQGMRKRIVEANIIESIIGLGPNLFYNSSMESCIVICRMKKTKERNRKILFINAVNEVTREKSQSFLTSEHIEKILNAYRQFCNVDGFCQVVDLDTVLKNEANLSVQLYVRPVVDNFVVKESESQNSVRDYSLKYDETYTEMHENISKLIDDLKELGLDA